MTIGLLALPGCDVYHATVLVTAAEPCSGGTGAVEIWSLTATTMLTVPVLDVHHARQHVCAAVQGQSVTFFSADRPIFASVDHTPLSNDTHHVQLFVTGTELS